ncbi:unnamed protein product, partial [Effrenium voratum]
GAGPARCGAARAGGHRGLAEWLRAAGSVSVEQMLDRRRHEEQERLKRDGRPEVPPPRRDSRGFSSARAVSWDERQEMVMLRKQQHQEERGVQAHRRHAAGAEPVPGRSGRSARSLISEFMLVSRANAP